MNRARAPVSPHRADWLAGVDEAGRGPLAGPVVAAAVILDNGAIPSGIADSKTLSAAARDRLAAQIRSSATAFGIGVASVEEIDSLNILAATMLAMQRAVAALSPVPARIHVDGNRTPRFVADGSDIPATAIVRGDATDLAIGAASILAKVDRDARMADLDRQFPEYGFARHKGYATRAHRDALQLHGACPEHRRSFAPVRAVCTPARAPQ